jgi:hypothetical protein
MNSCKALLQPPYGILLKSSKTKVKTLPFQLYLKACGDNCLVAWIIPVIDSVTVAAVSCCGVIQNPFPYTLLIASVLFCTCSFS